MKNSILASVFMHPWVERQSMRRVTYTRWAEAVHERGIDPTEERFAELAGLD